MKALQGKTEMNKRRGVGLSCAYCKRTMEDRNSPTGLAVTRDHHVPKSKGGRKIVLACRTCNSIKGDMLPGDWEAFMSCFPGWWENPKFSNLGNLKKKYDTTWQGTRERAVRRAIAPKKATKAETQRAFAEWTAKARRERQQEGKGFPIAESKMILRHGKDYWTRWKASGEPMCDCCRLSVPKSVPLEYKDPRAQAAFEGAYRNRLHMLRVNT